MKFSSILTVKFLALVSALVFATVGVVHAQSYPEKDDTMQKPADSTQYPGTSRDDYGTSGTDQRNGYDRPSEPGDDQYHSQGYNKDVDTGMYDWSGTDGTGPKIKGRY
jgi:hypothetical protein